ncbi:MULTISPECIES: MoaD/ThiS family protein [Roseateles]|jgi:molybdopterin synthase sulfur carrier subunit|uniref:MoaD/ThiS family protein n=1 Tax=Roseateles TaxID=93681 RepID=UPI0021DB5981
MSEGVAMIQVQLKFFASLREQLGSGERLEIPAGTSVAALRAQLCARSAVHAEALAPGRAVRCALNQQMVASDSAVIPADAELAFFPPVTGG